MVIVAPAVPCIPELTLYRGHEISSKNFGIRLFEILVRILRRASPHRIVSSPILITPIAWLGPPHRWNDWLECWNWLELDSSWLSFMLGLYGLLPCVVSAVRDDSPLSFFATNRTVAVVDGFAALTELTYKAAVLIDQMPPPSSAAAGATARKPNAR